MWSFLASLFTGGINAILGTVGKTITDIHTSETVRQTNQNDSGAALARTTVDGHTAAANTRADVQKSQGTWGPFGFAGFMIAMIFAYYTAMIVLDSTPWHIGLTTKLYIIPWIEWRQHVVGSWGVSVLPGKLEDSYHAILQALFYVGPPSAALVIAAKAFRR
jgi:hypothetical protein